MPETFAPQVRTQFAKRLKSLRAQRGFGRARYFAQTLGIEENRYTRYERAEVEPSLTLIHKMCETLKVSPNELLGFEAAPVVHQRHAEIAGFAESDPEPASGGKSVDGVSNIAWSLASDVVDLRHTGRKSADPLTTVKETSILFRSLVNEPFDTVAKLSEDAALAKASGKRKAEIAALMNKLAAAARTSRERR